jgi:GntR family transcriptional regulator
LPSEHELARQFRVGRPTVRQATELLVRRGMIERRRGSGTLVRPARPEVDLFTLSGTIAAFERTASA